MLMHAIERIDYTRLRRQGARLTKAAVTIVAIGKCKK